MELLKKIKAYIKENKWYILVMLIGSIAFIMQMKEVVLYADDFSLGIVSKGGLKEIFSYFQNNYMNWGGGLTCIWATIFLMFRIGVWKIFQCAIIIATVIMATKMITYGKDKKYKPWVAGIIWLCLYVLTIWISREVLYWLDGALAYEFTAFQIFLYFYYLYTRMCLNIKKSYDKILLPIVAFFAGWSSAQTGPLVLIIPVLIMLWKKIIKKEKISKFYYLTTIIGIIGFCIFYFAPGNAARMNSAFEKYANYNILQKIIYRVDSVYGLMFDFKTYQFMGIPFYFLLTVGLTAFVGHFFYHKEENKKLRGLAYTTTIIQIVFCIICAAMAMKIPYVEKIANVLLKFENPIAAINEGKNILLVLTPYAVTSLVMLALVVESYLISLKTKNPILVITIISGLIMQGIMVMAPYGPLRTTYYTIMFLWIAIAYLIQIAYEKEIKIGMIAILILSMYSIELGIFAFIIFFIFESFLNNIEKRMKAKHEIVVIIIAMLIISTGNYIVTIKNYAINKDIYHENIARIEECQEKIKKGENVKELQLLAPKDEVYGFTAMTGIEWVENAIKQYFELEGIELKTENIK